MASKNAKKYADDDDDFEDKPIKKSDRNMKEMPSNLTMEDLMRTSMAKNLFSERGFGDDNDKQKSKTNAKGKAKIVLKDQIIPGQAIASMKELLGELQKAEAGGNHGLALSLIETILEKGEIDSEQRCTFQVKRCQILYDAGRFDPCQKGLQQILDENTDLPNNLLLKLLIVKCKCQLEVSTVWSAVVDQMRIQGIVHYLKNTKEVVSDDEMRDWAESEQDKDFASAEELTLNFQVKIAKEKNFVNTVFATGVNPKSNSLGLGEKGCEGSATFKPIPELRNKKILAVACGENHVLALVDGDSFNLFEVQDGRNKEKNAFGSVDLIGWGLNNLGQLMGYESLDTISKPTVIRYFLGKNIIGIHASRASSIAFDDQGNVYEWGYDKLADKPGINITLKHKAGILSVKQGHSFSVVLTKDNKIFFRGSIEGILESKTYTSVITTATFTHIEAGSNHFVAFSSEKDIYALGSNQLGQIGLSNGLKKVEVLLKVDLPKYVGTPEKVLASKDTSFLLNTDGEFYMWGSISEGSNKLKTISKPQQYEVDTGEQILRVVSSGTQIFLIGRMGVVYVWEHESSSKFKPYKNVEGETFSDVYSGKAMQFLVKGFVDSTLCTVYDQDPNPESFHRTYCKVRLINKDGVYYQKPPHPLRYYLYFSTKEENIEKITSMVITESKMAAKQNQGEMFTFLNNFECPVLDVSAKPNEEDFSSNEINFTFETDGFFYLYIFINEQVINNGAPVFINMAKSKEQEAFEQDEEAQRKRKEELRKQKEDAEMRRKLAEQQEKEERERRRLETQKRAEEALKDHLDKERAEKEKADEERRLRKELLVGGGFDLEKAALMKANSGQIEEKKVDLQKTSTSIKAGGSTKTVPTEPDKVEKKVSTTSSTVTKPGSNTGSRTTTSTTATKTTTSTTASKPGITTQKSTGVGAVKKK